MKKICAALLLLITLLIASCGNNTEESSAPLQTVSTVISADAQAAEITFVNVGDADAALISVAGKNYLVDTGTKKAFKTLNSVISAAEIKTFDGVFITHSHSDHLGGLSKLADKYKIDKLYSSDILLPDENGKNKIEEAAEDLKLDYEKLKVNDTVEIAENIYFIVLGPVVLDLFTENNDSLVMKLYVYGKTVLFTGDMEYNEERTLLDGDTDLSADVLKIANHGNPDASSTRFLNAVTPQYAVISANREEDSDSANIMIINALGDIPIYITDETETGVYMKITENGEITVLCK